MFSKKVTLGLCWLNIVDSLPKRNTRCKKENMMLDAPFNVCSQGSFLAATNS